MLPSAGGLGMLFFAFGLFINRPGRAPPARYRMGRSSFLPSKKSVRLTCFAAIGAAAARRRSIPNIVATPGIFTLFFLVAGRTILAAVRLRTAERPTYRNMKRIHELRQRT